MTPQNVKRLAKLLNLPPSDPVVAKAVTTIEKTYDALLTLQLEAYAVAIGGRVNTRLKCKFKIGEKTKCVSCDLWKDKEEFSILCRVMASVENKYYATYDIRAQYVLDNYPSNGPNLKDMIQNALNHVVGISEARAQAQKNKATHQAARKPNTKRFAEFLSRKGRKYADLSEEEVLEAWRMAQVLITHNS